MTMPSNARPRDLAATDDDREDMGRGLGVGLSVMFGMWLGVMFVVLVVLS